MSAPIQFRWLRARRFSLLHLIAAVLITAAALVVLAALAVWIAIGPQGLTLLEGLAVINTRFVGEYDPEEVTDSAMAGMVAGLNDRWSYYLDAGGYAAQNLRRSNQYVGIGVTVSYEREEGLLVQSVTEGGPAQAAGIVAGDLIAAVDGTSLAGEARYGGAALIQGEAGTQVALTLLGADGTERTATVTRASLDSDPVTSELLAGNVGYVRVANFYDRSAQRVEEAVTGLMEQGAQALIFDMRDNGGGYLEQLTQMLDFLLPEGPIFISRDRAGHETVTTSDPECVELPMAVLVNENTYSAAEFFAAELQEWGAAVIVGTPTSGKGYSQQTFALPGGGAMSISTAAYFTGRGTSLTGTGLTLDREVALTEAGDTQLEAALELLEADRKT